MQPKFALLRVLLAMALLTAPAALASGSNQGDQDKVLRVDSATVSCEEPVATTKVEGDLGATIEFSTDDPIAFVTVKSGNGATVVSYALDTFSGTITLSKDVSNYVVWVCPGGEGGGGEGEGGSE